MSQSGLFHPHRRGAGESQTLCNTIGTQTERLNVNVSTSATHQCDRLLSSRKKKKKRTAAHPLAAF